jgi:transcriptional regulator with XRE-family HTH domain
VVDDPSTDDRLRPSRITSHYHVVLGEGNYRRISKKAGLSPQHVARVLKGMRGCSLHVAKSIADAAGVSLDALYLFIASQPKFSLEGRRTRASFMKDRIELQREALRRAKLGYRVWSGRGKLPDDPIDK